MKRFYKAFNRRIKIPKAMVVLIGKDFFSEKFPKSFNQIQVW